MQSLKEKIIHLDQVFLLWLANFRRPLYTRFLSLVSYSGTSIAWGIIVFLFWLLEWSGYSFLPQSELFLRCMIPAGIAWILGNTIKFLVKRPRPFQVMKNLSALVPPPGLDDSFPSNHVATTTAFLTCLLVMGHPLAALVLVWWLLIGFSRMYLGVHYPTDVIFGSLLGFLTGIVFFCTWLR